MTATWLNGKGSRWTVMEEHLKHLCTSRYIYGQQLMMRRVAQSLNQKKTKKGTTFIFRPKKSLNGIY